MKEEFTFKKVIKINGIVVEKFIEKDGIELYTPENENEVPTVYVVKDNSVLFKIELNETSSDIGLKITSKDEY